MQTDGLLRPVWHGAVIGQNCRLDSVPLEPGIAHEFETYGGDRSKRIVTSVLPCFTKHLRFEQLNAC